MKIELDIDDAIISLLKRLMTQYGHTDVKEFITKWLTMCAISAATIASTTPGYITEIAKTPEMQHLIESLKKKSEVTQ